MTALPIDGPNTASRRRRRRPGKPKGPALNVTFASLGVPAPVVAALAEAGITTPFPIQAAALPDALAGLDILGRGRTGSGKTLAFAIPLVAGLADGHTSACRPRGLVLVPTRELASQVHAVLQPLAQAVGLSATTIFGGTSQKLQHAPNTMGNFCFDVTLSYRRLELPRRAAGS
jgi:superfamily II DNA/RNA helicase